LPSPIVPERAISLFLLLLHFLSPFSAQKIACQVQKPLNPLPDNNIRMKKSFPPTAIIEIEGKKSRKSGPKGQGFFTLSQINEDFTNSATDFKDFRTN
jgi:hypothetical protein